MIKKETFTFLKGLIENNNREWFAANKNAYEIAKTNLEDFALGLVEKLSKIDQSIPADISAKQCVMRIYRDIRFSKDKTPYKNNFGIGLSNKGKGMDGPGYYVQIQPSNSFIAGGYWMPQGEAIKAIRQEIDYNAGDLKKIIHNVNFKKYFGELESNDKLKTVPKGYDASHPEIELLKLKSFTVIHQFKDSELSDTNAVAEVAAGLGMIKPLNDYLNNAVTN